MCAVSAGLTFWTTLYTAEPLTATLRYRTLVNPVFFRSLLLLITSSFNAGECVCVIIRRKTIYANHLPGTPSDRENPSTPTRSENSLVGLYDCPPVYETIRYFSLVDGVKPFGKCNILFIAL